MSNPFETIDLRLASIEKLLSDLKTQNSSLKSPNEKEGPEILTASQACEFLNLALPTVYSLVSRRILTSYKRQKKLYFKRSELLEWIQTGRRTPISEIKAKAKSFKP